MEHPIDRTVDGTFDGTFDRAISRTFTDERNTRTHDSRALSSSELLLKIERSIDCSTEWSALLDSRLRNEFASTKSEGWPSRHSVHSASPCKASYRNIPSRIHTDTCTSYIDMCMAMPAA